VPLSFADDEIRAEAVRLGLIAEGEELPRRLRSRAVAALTAERRRPSTPAEVPIAQRIVIQPGGDITVDDKLFPWVVQAEQMAVTLNPDGTGLVTLTMPALNIQILKPATPESENRA
jgi:hypothetical protein